MSFQTTLLLALTFVAGGVVANLCSLIAAFGDWRTLRPRRGSFHPDRLHAMQAIEILVGEVATFVFQAGMFGVRLWAYTCWPPFSDDGVERAWLIDVRLVTFLQVVIACKSLFKLYMRRAKRRAEESRLLAQTLKTT